MRDGLVQSYPYKHNLVPSVFSLSIRTVRRVVKVAFSSSERLNHWYFKYLQSETRLHILTTTKIYRLNTYNKVNRGKSHRGQTAKNMINLHASCVGSEGEAVVKAHASHPRGPCSAPGVDAICGCCWFSPLLQEVSLRVLQFSPLLKTQHFQIPIRSGTQGHVELLCTSWVNKPITIRV